MMRFLLGLLLIIAFLGFFLFMTPLSFLLKVGNVSSTGLTWSNAYGTIFTGGLDDVRYGPQPIGDVSLSIKPRELLKARLQYELKITRGIGDIEGSLFIGSDQVGLRAIDASIDVSELVGLKQEIRDLGGVVDVRADEIIFRGGECDAASGRLETDTLVRAAETYGRNMSPMKGIFECDGPMLHIPMSATSEEGDRVDARLRLGLAERSTAEAQVRTDDAQLGLVLLALGFSTADGAYHYRRDRMIEVGL